VKRLLVRDNWNAMSQQYDSQYGQDYDYTTTAKVNGVVTTISSGVASYEPGIGSEENPFREILQFENKLPLASAQYGAIEMPMLEGLYPAPVVGYSRVTVRSIHRKGTHADSVVRSSIGKQVTEFYTAKDYPSFSTYTPMYNMDYHQAPPFTFFYKETIDRRTTSQGFLVETNDMHGKMKSQAAYSESDENTPLSYTVHTYKNTGANGLNDLVDFVHNEQGGAVVSGNMGVDMELMTDVREFSVRSTGTNTQAQVDFFSFVPWPIFGVFVYPLDSYSENLYRAVTTTKLINYHAIEDSVIVNDKGSTVTTKNIAYDAETGSPIVNKTLNEFNAPVYSTSYPAYWAYSGMGPAYSNIGMEFKGVNISGGKVTSGIPNQGVLESGDELYVEGKTGSQPICPDPSPDRNKLWVFDFSKNTTALTVPAANRNLVLMDTAGRPYTMSGGTVRIIRSGHRNLLGANAATVTSMVSPIATVSGTRKLVIDGTSKAIAASAIEFREKWQTDNDVINKVKVVTDPSCNEVEIIDCNGYLEKHINPYLKGLVGNFRDYRGLVFYDGRVESDPTTMTQISRNGALNNFKLYWDFDGNNNLVPDISNGKWVWNTQITKVNARGLEIENKNALNIYTSAQYGYHKLLPLAITQNSRLQESSYEGFEDITYQANIDNEGAILCPKRNVDYTGIPNTVLVKTDSANFTAHTGSFVMGVQKQTTAIRSFAVQSSGVDGYSILFANDTAKVLTNEGINVISKVKHPNYMPLTPAPDAIYGDFRMTINPVGDTITHNTNGWSKNYLYQVTCLGYVQAQESGVYIVDYSAWRSGLYYDQEGIYDTYFSLYSSDGKYLSQDVVDDDPHTHHATICVPKGVYQLQITCVGSAQAFCGQTACNNVPLPTDEFFWLMHKGSAYLNIYKTATTQNGCISTRPIASTDSMFNGLFTVPANKPMVFSAWVKEDCGTPCNLTSYAQNQVQLQFNDGANTVFPFKPTGPIIEGWQRYEGTFTAPATATSMNMKLINSSTSMIYFDDIRMFPFNGNMKSYAYDPRTLRLSAELDENNYATFYNYDEEGQLVRVKQETIQGIKTIKETRSAKQKSINTVQ